MYQIATQVLDTEVNCPVFNQIESVRTELLTNQDPITQPLPGAGSKMQTKKLRIKDIVRWSSIPKYQGKWLFRLVRLFEPDRILELGTSFGLSSLYLHLARPEARMVTVEGNQTVARIADSLTRNLRAPTLQFKVGSFAEQIPSCLNELGSVDLVFLDGDHQYESTLKYFEMILPHMSKGGIFILDDIYWSTEMKGAWDRLKDHPAVSSSVDIYYKGLLFFSEIHPGKVNKTLIPFWWKPFPF